MTISISIVIYLQSKNKTFLIIIIVIGHYNKNLTVKGINIFFVTIKIVKSTYLFKQPNTHTQIPTHHTYYISK